jgi:hypothetical protein
MAEVKAEQLGQLANHEIVTLAVYLLGGEAHKVDTEDIAKKSNELAPGRFTWRKYSDQINIEHIRAFLSDAKKPKNGAYLTGVGNQVEKILSACKRIHVCELRAGVSRHHRREGFAPPQRVLLQL